jgi:hypothetical protein
MRENMGLYRGKRLDNGEWVEGDLIHNDTGHYYIAYDECVFETEDCCGRHIETDRYLEINPSTVGQFTGLCDKNGKMIFEGDICKVKNPNGEAEADWEIKWAPRSSCFPYAPEDGFDNYDITTLGWAMDMGFEFEVIGTIHDHGKGIVRDAKA